MENLSESIEFETAQKSLGAPREGNVAWGNVYARYWEIYYDSSGPTCTVSIGIVDFWGDVSDCGGQTRTNLGSFIEVLWSPPARLASELSSVGVLSLIAVVRPLRFWGHLLRLCGPNLYS